MHYRAKVERMFSFTVVGPELAAKVAARQTEPAALELPREVSAYYYPLNL